MTAIHPMAVVDPKAEIGEGCEIGPFCTIGPKVKLGRGNRLISAVHLAGETEIGDENLFYPGACLGFVAQDIKTLSDPDGTMKVGGKNVFREHFTAHLGTRRDRIETTIGSGCHFLANSHIGHDSRIGDGVVLSNNVCIGGHVEVRDRANVGGNSAVHQFCRIGEGAMVGGMSGVKDDVIPYGFVFGISDLIGLNLVGLKRKGFGPEVVNPMLKFYKELFGGEGLLADRIARARALYPDHELIGKIIAFIDEDASRPLCQPVKKAGRKAG